MLAAFLSATGKLVGADEPAVSRFGALMRQHGAALQRLTLGYEASPEARRDLQQEIWVALWRALPSFEGRSSLKTWTFRVAHNVCATHVLRARRQRAGGWASLEELAETPSAAEGEARVVSRASVERLSRLLRELQPLDRQLVLLFLEGFSPREIAEVTGLSDTNVSTKLSRLRAFLRVQLERGQIDG